MKYDQAKKICQELAGFASFWAFEGLRGMMYASWSLEDITAARKYFQKAIEIAVSLKATGCQAQCLPVAVSIAAFDKQNERAVEFLALAFHHPASATGWIEKFPLIQKLKSRLEKELPPQVFTASWQRGLMLDFETTSTALLKEI